MNIFLYNTDKVCESYLKNSCVGDALSSRDIDYKTQCSSKQRSCVVTYCHVLLRSDWGQIIVIKKNNKCDICFDFSS